MPQDLISQFDRKYALPIETYRQVQNITQRNAIPNGIRWEGMMCYVVSEGKSYVLTGGLTDSDWVEFGTLVNVNVVDNLASTSATDALSANQGRVLEQSKLSDAPSDGDIYGRKDGAWTLIAAGGTEWGDITGTLSDQTDLQSALDGKVPTTRTLTAGNGLTGGGDLSANRTFTLGTPGSTTLSSTNAVTASSHTHAFAPGGTTAQYIRGDGSLATFPSVTGAAWGSITGTLSSQTDLQSALDGKVAKSGDTMTGNLTVNGTVEAVGSLRTTAAFPQVVFETTSDSSFRLLYRDGNNLIWRYNGTTNGTVYHSGNLTLSTLGGVPTTRTLTAGNGITGGGDLSANRTFTLGTPGSTTLASTNAVTTTSHTHAFAPGGTTAQYIRGDGSLATYAGGVTSVFGRTGAVTAQTGDYTFAQIGSKPTTISGYGITDFNSLGDARWLGIGAKAADSDLLRGVHWGNINTPIITSSTFTLNGTGSNQISFSTGGSINLSGNLNVSTSLRMLGGANSFIDLLAGNLMMRDNTTTRFTFGRTTGNFTASGVVSAQSFNTPTWEIVETAGVLQFKQGGVTRFQMKSTGVIEATNFKLGLV